MFKLIKSLFGKGKLVYNFTLVDGSNGNIEVDYVGDVSTVNHDEVKMKIERESGYKFHSFTFERVI